MNKLLELQYHMGKRERDLSPFKLECSYAWLDRPYRNMKNYLKCKRKKIIVENLIQMKTKTVFPVQFQTGKHTDKHEKTTWKLRKTTRHRVMIQHGREKPTPKNNIEKKNTKTQYNPVLEPDVH